MLGFVFMQISDKIDPSAIDTLLHGFVIKLTGLGEKIIIAVITYFIGAWIISLLRKIIAKVLSRRKVDKTAASFINSLINTLLNVALFIVIVGILGIPATSLAALVAAGGLAVGMAMKDNLSNFAGGVMLLMNKPFKIGDQIIAQGQDGVVIEIGILYTILLMADGRTVFLPNGPLSTGSITNYSTQGHRRIDIAFNVNYGNDADILKQIIFDEIKKNSKVLNDPFPFVGVTAVNNGNIDITIRVWVINVDYGTVSVALNESVYRAMSDKGIFTSSSLTVKMLKD